MKYYLIANNNNLTNEFINNLNITEDDFIILFNHHLPIKFDIIKYHTNKYLFIRKN
jgi:hypothetical protein